MGEKQRGRGKHIYILLACILTAWVFTGGCAHYIEGIAAAPDFNEATDLTKKGSYKASLLKYERIISQHPLLSDKALFEMGVIYALPKNQQKDYPKSLDCFQKLIKDYPKSRYRQNSEAMASLLNEMISNDKKLIVQRRQTDKLEQQTDSLKQQVAELEKKIEQMKEIDMNLGQKKKAFPK